MKINKLFKKCLKQKVSTQFANVSPGRTRRTPKQQSKQMIVYLGQLGSL